MVGDTNRVEIEVNGKMYGLGYTSGSGCNCRIGTLRQKLKVVCNTAMIRQALEKRHRGKPTRIQPMDYLELETHWKDVIDLIGQHNLVSSGAQLLSSQFQVVCVDLNMLGNGDVVGAGSTKLVIARVNEKHFVPLIHLFGQRNCSGAASSGLSTMESKKEEQSMI